MDNVAYLVLVMYSNLYIWPYYKLQMSVNKTWIFRFMLTDHHDNMLHDDVV